MGRKDEDDLSAAQILYPCMQCADIFYLKVSLFLFIYNLQMLNNFQADICQLGMDQRKVNMLAREYCDEAKIKYKPVIVSHHILLLLLFYLLSDSLFIIRLILKTHVGWSQGGTRENVQE